MSSISRKTSMTSISRKTSMTRKARSTRKFLPCNQIIGKSTLCPSSHILRKMPFSIRKASPRISS